MNKKVYVDLSQQDVQDIINAYEKDIEKFNKQKEVLDKIKEEIKKYKYTDSWGDTVVLAKYIEDLLEEIE
jgi:ATP-dependent Lon protease